MTNKLFVYLGVNFIYMLVVLWAYFSLESFPVPTNKHKSFHSGVIQSGGFIIFLLIHAARGEIILKFHKRRTACISGGYTCSSHQPNSYCCLSSLLGHQDQSWQGKTGFEDEADKRGLEEQRKGEQKREEGGKKKRIESAGTAAWTSARVPSLSSSLPFHMLFLSSPLLLCSSSLFPGVPLARVWLVMAFQRV